MSDWIIDGCTGRPRIHKGPVLLSRENFRNQVFKRDHHTCVFCDKLAQDAHHILERRLWSDGGYYLDNGASVCEEHHLACERTDISVEDVRQACGITQAIIPPQLFMDESYDKWGNPVLPNGQRLRGELFHDESVQKILADKLPQFTSWIKYPKTLHLPWSPGLTDGDKVIPSLSSFEGKKVIVTEKMDGENTTLYRGYMHARSLDSRNHPSRNWVRQFHAGISEDIPDHWRVCGENLYATHSIRYESLPSYFLGFSIWDEYNRCLPWNETVEWFNLIGIISVPVLYEGPFDTNVIRSLWKGSGEGYVVRLAEGFTYAQFHRSVAKYVRKNHVQTDQHWAQGPIVKNGLA